MKYSQIISEFKFKLLNMLNKYFDSLDREIRVNAGGVNILNQDSAIAGWVFEEIIIQKLVELSKNNDGNEEIKIVKQLNSNNNSSYDFYGMYKGILFLINIKGAKRKNSNDSISSVDQLYKDYLFDENRVKSFIVLKVKYSIGQSKVDKENVLIPERISAFALEEYDFANGFSVNKGNKRLNVSNKFRKDHAVSENLISYHRFKFQLENIIRA